MMKALSIAILAGLLAGCATSSPRAFDTDHPANPDAASAPSTRPSSLTDVEPVAPTTDEAPQKGGHHHDH